MISFNQGNHVNHENHGSEIQGNHVNHENQGSDDFRDDKGGHGAISELADARKQISSFLNQ